MVNHTKEEYIWALKLAVRVLIGMDPAEAPRLAERLRCGYGSQEPSNIDLLLAETVESVIESDASRSPSR